MAQDIIVHTKHLGDNRYRDLQVYYDKGGMNYWDYSQKPKGIYFASHVYSRQGGMMSWSTGQKGDGYICVAELTNYRPSVLKAVRARIEAEADAIHDVFEGCGATVQQLKQYLVGDIPTLGHLDREAA
jgi:hypothetical protein